MRSNKTDPSANGEKAASNSQSSASNNNKDKSTTSRGKTQSKQVTGKAMGNDQQQPNGSPDPRENGINGSEDVEMGDDDVDESTKRDKDGDDEMTVVVPPSKSSKGGNEDVKMEGTEGDESKQAAEQVDPVEKAVAGKSILEPDKAQLPRQHGNTNPEPPVRRYEVQFYPPRSRRHAFRSPVHVASVAFDIVDAQDPQSGSACPRHC